MRNFKLRSLYVLFPIAVVLPAFSILITMLLAELGVFKHADDYIWLIVSTLIPSYIILSFSDVEWKKRIGAMVVFTLLFPLYLKILPVSYMYYGCYLFKQCL